MDSYFQNNPLSGFRARLAAQCFRITSCTRSYSSGDTPAASASFRARIIARNITSPLSVSDSSPEQMALNEIRVAAEHGKSVGIEGCTAPGAEGWSEVPVTGIRGKDVAVDGTMVVFR